MLAITWGALVVEEVAEQVAMERILLTLPDNIRRTAPKRYERDHHFNKNQPHCPTVCHSPLDEPMPIEHDPGTPPHPAKAGLASCSLHCCTKAEGPICRL
ncbi:hypothetical protein SRHO_G00312380 [Serrasalmus rhombeus]